MNVPVTVHISETLIKRLEKRNENLPDAAWEAVQSYYALVDATAEEMRGMFTDAEAALLCELFKNTDMGIDRFPEWPMLFAWDVEDVERCEKISANYGVDPVLLAEKLEVLTHSQALWLMDKIRQFKRREDAAALGEEVVQVDFATMD